MLKLKERNVTPPDKYRFKFPQDGFIVYAMSLDDWFRDIEKHYRDNQYPMPADWREQAEDQLCHLLPAGWCDHPGEFHVNARSTMETIMAGTRVFASFIASGAKLVSKDEAEQRAKTCASCYMAIPVPGCSPCVGLSNLVAEIVGAGETSADALLENKSCAWCGCSARANVWIPVEVSEKGVTDAMLDIAPNEWCWKSRQIRELRLTRNKA